MLIALWNANEAHSFPESSFGMRIGWVRRIGAPVADAQPEIQTQLQQPAPVEKAVHQSVWDGV